MAFVSCPAFFISQILKSVRQILAGSNRGGSFHVALNGEAVGHLTLTRVPPSQEGHVAHLFVLISWVKP